MGTERLNHVQILIVAIELIGVEDEMINLPD